MASETTRQRMWTLIRIFMRGRPGEQEAVGLELMAVADRIDFLEEENRVLLQRARRSELLNKEMAANVSWDQAGVFIAVNGPVRERLSGSGPSLPVPYAEYVKYLASQDWRRQRVFAYKRADYKCEKCGWKLDLEVHHKTYERLYMEAPGDLEVLCRRCHAAVHGR